MKTIRANSLRAVFALLLTGLVAAFVRRNWSQFVESARLVGDLPLAVYWVTLPLLFATFGLAALSYRFLAFHRLRMRELYIIELTAALATRLIPSGVGGLGVHGLYLHNRKHTVAQATAAVSVNNLLGLVVHSLLLLGMLSFVDTNIDFRFTWTKTMTITVALAVLLLLVLVSLPAVRRRMAGFGHGLLS
ncbi:flippase-like domain-containing protein, partial [Candidatus Saccharibacteria bacterium]|nr:flippase-like domain-containing protein [Candidatus Saccharibacteria bacterium]